MLFAPQVVCTGADGYKLALSIHSHFRTLTLTRMIVRVVFVPDQVLQLVGAETSELSFLRQATCHNAKAKTEVFHGRTHNYFLLFFLLAQSWLFIASMVKMKQNVTLALYSQTTFHLVCTNVDK